MLTNPIILIDQEAARLLRMPPARLNRLARENLIPSVQLPDGELRYIEADLWAWVARHRHTEQEASNVS